MPTPLSARERNKTERRRHIFTCAMQLFEEHGFHPTTYSQIAQASGVSRGTVFNYFPFKEAILIELFAEALEDLRTRLRRRRATAEASVDDEMRFVFDELADFVEHRRALVLPLSYELLNPDPERSRAAYLALPLGPILRDVIGRARAAGVVRTDYSRDRLARIVANTYFITALQWAAYRHDRSVRDELRLALDLTMEGLKARS